MSRWMDLQSAINFVPAFVLAFFRMTGLMVMSPLFGSAKIPRRMKILFANIAAMGMMSSITKPIVFPDSLAELTIGIGGEILFGALMGLIMSFTFVAAQWAGEMIGQQIGFNLSEVFDPQFGQGGTLVGDIYFMLTLVIFLLIGGHRQMIMAVHGSFISVPLLSLTFNQPLFDLFVDMLSGAMLLSLRLAAPIFFTMLVVDLGMGAISKAMPQFNIMSAGLTIRSVVGLLVLFIGVALTSDALSASLSNSLEIVTYYWKGAH